MARTERYRGSKTVLSLIGVVFIAMIGLYIYLSQNVVAGVVAAVVMIVVGFFFATVSGNLVGLIGSSNNPISGLTLSTLIIAALLMVALGVSGAGGVAVVLASLVMYYPLYVLHVANMKSGGIGFGDAKLPAPQAGLMATLAQGIVGGEMAWPLVICGAFFGLALVMIKVKSPMLVAVGMYLPFATTFSIFVGGIIRWIFDVMGDRMGHNAAQKTRSESVGILIASGLIAGEALTGLLVATLTFYDVKIYEVFKDPSYAAGAAVIVALVVWMIKVPLANAGRPEDPAPPAAMM